LKSANLTTTHVFGAAIRSDVHWIFTEIFGVTKLEFLAIIQHSFCADTCSHTDTILTCDKRTDRQRHEGTAYIALCMCIMR